MTVNDELIEQVARAIALDAEDYDGDVLWWQGWVDSAKAAIAAMQPHIAAEREDAAQAERAAVVEWLRGLGFAHESQNRAVGQMAAAIEAGEHHA